MASFLHYRRFRLVMIVSHTCVNDSLSSKTLNNAKLSQETSPVITSFNNEVLPAHPESMPYKLYAS